MGVDEIIKDRLREWGIAFDCVSHERVQTIEDCAWAQRALSCVVPKNLFLTPRNQSAFYLCLVAPDALFRTADISKQIKSSRLSFGPQDRLLSFLRTYPGAISPLGLIFEESLDLRLLIDERLRGIPRLGFHPNDNGQTLAMSGADFFGMFLPRTGHEPAYVRLG